MKDIRNLAPKDKVSHPLYGVGTVGKVTEEPSALVLFDNFVARFTNRNCSDLEEV